MSLQIEHEEHCERLRREAQYQRREEEREAQEARRALEMAFEERAGCTDACFDACVHTAECMAAGVAPALAIPLTEWLAGQRIATAPRYAAIGNGLFIRVGTGRKRRAA